MPNVMAGNILLPWQHLNLVLHFVCELRESRFVPCKLDPDFRRGDKMREKRGYSTFSTWPRISPSGYFAVWMLI
jgi:hypothetical protein